MNASEYENYSEAIAAYDEALNDHYFPVIAGGIEFDRSRILRELDPIAYRVGFFDWLDAEGIDSDDLDDEGYDDLP
ncbi:hypothetical protein SEA_LEEROYJENKINS_124 [Microbacterium phage LeeroyJenkins]|nr:hypothetical protein SEA_LEEROYJENKINS_124 [Microbacterium phage LeeroyJenkins]